MLRRNKRLVFKLFTISLISVVFVVKLWGDKSQVAKRRVPFSIQEEYVKYTTQLRGLKPIKSESLVDNQLLPIINDVFDFKYGIDIASERLTPRCQISNVSRHLLLLIIVSAPENKQERQLIRQSLVNQRLILDSSKRLFQPVFLVGLPSGQGLDKDQLQNDVIDESKKNGDLVQMNVIDTYSNLTIKSVALLHWALTRCPAADYVIKSDDDNYVNIFFLLTELIPNLVPANDEGAIYGTTNVFLWPSRDEGII